MTALPLDRPKSLTARAFDRLLHSIVHGEIAYGTMLSEKAVAETFGTSKTPIREAFFQLQSLGLVEIQPQRGCYVPSRPSTRCANSASCASNSKATRWGFPWNGARRGC